MRKILFSSHSASLTGAPILLHEIASRMDRSNCDLRFVVGESGPMVGRFEKIGPTIVDELYPDELKYWREIKRLGKRFAILKKPTPDILFCNTIHTAKWLVYAKMLGIPTIMHVLELSQGFKTLTGFEHWMIKHLSGKIIGASGAVKQYLVDVQRIAEENIQVIHAGIDVARFENESGAPTLRKRLGIDDAIVIGTVGRITHVKGSDLFVELASKIKQSPGLARQVKYLVIATTADKEYYEKFKSLIARNNLINDFVVLENIPDTAAYFAAMDVYVTTAREDPFPVVILEAMASRKPVAGFATGGIPEAVTPECGVLVDRGNVDELYRAISALAADPDRRTSLGNEGRKRVEKLFTLERYANDVEMVISSLVGK